MDSKVAIIIVNWNGWKNTIECLESLRKITYTNYSIIVVDNGSFDSSVDKIKKWADGEIPVESKFFPYDFGDKPVPLISCKCEKQRTEKGFLKGEVKSFISFKKEIVLIQLDDNLGFAGGNNIGIAYALKNDVDYVFLLNNDCVVDPGFLEPIIQIGEFKNNTGIMGSKVYTYGSPDVVQSVGAYMNLWTGRAKIIGSLEVDYGQYEEPQEVDWVSGAAIAIKANVIRKIGFFDEGFFICYEETDLCHRVKKAGFKIFSVPNSKVWHKAGASTPKPLSEYYLTKNRVLFMRKNAESYQLLIFLLFYLIGSLKRVLNYLIQRDRDSVAAILRGMKHGIRYLWIS